MDGGDVGERMRWWWTGVGVGVEPLGVRDLGGEEGVGGEEGGVE